MRFDPGNAQFLGHFYFRVSFTGFGIDCRPQSDNLFPKCGALARLKQIDVQNAFERLFREQAGESELAEAFNRQLLDDRNGAMAEKIAGYLEGEGTYFVLIGAAHFIGEQGIVARLERRGIEGQRVTTATNI